MSKHWKGFKQLYFEIYSGHEDNYGTFKQFVSTLNAENLLILRSFQFWLKFLVSYEVHVCLTTAVDQ